MSEYDAIARLYDPWSASVVEDISFYVDEALAAGSPVVELGVGTGRIAIPVAMAGVDVIGDRLFRGNARRVQTARRRGRRRSARRPSARRPAPPPGRRAGRARDLSVPRVPPSAQRRRAARGAPRSARVAPPGRQARLSTSSLHPARTSRRRTVAGSSASLASTSARTGISTHRRSRCRCGGRAASRR